MFFSIETAQKTGEHIPNFISVCWYKEQPHVGTAKKDDNSKEEEEQEEDECIWKGT
jgi:hypothetical protein